MISIEKDWKWVLAAKRFAWQASGGRANERLRRQGLAPIGKRVAVRWGDALELLADARLAGTDEGGKPRRIDLLFLDGTPKETLQYLRAAEPHLADGAVVIADNAGACWPSHHAAAVAVTAGAMRAADLRALIIPPEST